MEASFVATFYGEVTTQHYSVQGVSDCRRPQDRGEGKEAAHGRLNHALGVVRRGWIAKKHRRTQPKITDSKEEHKSREESAKLREGNKREDHPAAPEN
mmetsp:Transcript_86994/g.172694  ORF Transcript_86994/g.172694 Transcript_86994/m.172694 type:complete len:98 (+) Transcript_86994:894-1187(+)